MGIEDKQRSDERARQALTQSNIAPNFWPMTLPKLGKRAAELREYIQSETFSIDKREGMGRCIYGQGNLRIDTFHTFAKELALSLDNVYLITLRKLATTLVSNDGDFLFILDRVQALCISYFYDSSLGECPYTLQERSLVEDFLREKLHVNHRLYLSSSDAIKKMSWWSNDFRHELSKKCKEFSIGKNNRG